MTGTATVISETDTAAGDLYTLVPVSLVGVLGSATTVIDTYTLATATALYEGAETYIELVQTATDGVEIVKVELGGAAGDPAVNTISLEFPNSFMARWLNDGWRAFPALAPGSILTAATASP